MPGLGGIGTNAATLGPAFARLGHDVCIVTRGERSATTVENGVHVVRLEQRWFPDPRVERVVARMRFSAAARRFRPDIAQAAEWEATGWWLARRGGVPLITRLATPTYLLDELNQGAPARETAFIRRLERDQAARSAAILSPTAALASLVAREWAIEQPIHVIPNPVAVDEVRRLGSRAPKHEVPDSYLAFVGRLERRKGIEELGYAIGQVLPRHPDLHAVVMGADAGESGGAVMKQFEADVAGVRDRVHVLGELPRSEVLAILARCELALVPSRWENFANVALEALALGRPTIATEIGGFVEFLTHDVDGWLVPPGDGNALAVEIEQRIADRDARERVGAAARVTAEQFAVDKIAARIVELYEQIVSAEGAPQEGLYERGYRHYFRPEAPRDPFRRHYAAKRSAIVRTLQDEPRQRILDVGGGYGRISGGLSSRHDVTLVDISPEMLEEARRRWPGLRLEQADARSLPFEDETFDVVLANDLLPHLSDLRAALTELRRVCLRDGRVVFDTTNSSPWWVLAFPGYVNWRPRRLVATLLAEGVLPEWRPLIRHHRRCAVEAAAAAVGLRVDRVDEHGPPWTPKWHVWWTTRV
jgi:glycogen synthase